MKKYSRISEREKVQQKVQHKGQQKGHYNYVTLLIKQFVLTKLMQSLY